MWTRRDLLFSGIVGGVSLGWSAVPEFFRARLSALEPPQEKPLPPGPADAVYRRSLVLDTLAAGSGPDFDPKAALAAGLSGAVCDLPIFPRNFPSAVAAFAEWNTAFGRQGSGFLKVERAADLARAKQEERFAVILGCQDAAILDSSTYSVNDYNLGNLRLFHALGLRVLQLTHNERNALGDSFREKTNTGLSRLGERVVEEMNTLGMLIDLSHCGDQTTLEAIRLSKRPCAFTHAGCRALYPTLRNKPDSLIRELADHGGTMGIYNMSLWLTEKPEATIDALLDHIDHVVRVAGIEHVGFGSDGPVLGVTLSAADELAGMQAYAKKNLGLPGAERIPQHVTVRALDSPRRLALLADGLARRGYKEDAIEKFLGGNFARVLREAVG
ncbi:MAG TPA: membrane dipeptidase [Thermoanaerobaculia bacterium]|nr:membrane dipeptidase [Thermoanaerobaculia bacterium]